jgi:hypothetical protein
MAVSLPNVGLSVIKHELLFRGRSAASQQVKHGPLKLLAGLVFGDGLLVVRIFHSGHDERPFLVRLWNLSVAKLSMGKLN